jgi:hypothetical protein
VDKIHAQMIACLMQLATAIGSDDPDEQKELTASAMRQLETFVGSDQAEGARCLLVKMSEQTRNMVVDAKTSKWAALERQKKIDTIVDAAMAADPVVVELKKRVGKYAHPGVFKSKFSGVIESTLSGATWLTPGFAIPLGCEAALNAYIMATGGSEEGKIERTLLYNKRLESRKRLYESEASLAIDSYSFGSLTKNATLTAFAKAVVVELSSKDAANRILQNNYSIHDADVVPKMKTSKKIFDEA